LEKARDLYSREGKAAVPKDVAVTSWGYNGLNGASLRVLGALNQYGLLDSPEAKTVKLSPLALAIILEPMESPERAAAIQAAANMPVIFKEILDQYPDGLPSDEALKSYLVRHENFSEPAAKNLIASFRDALELAHEAAVSNISHGDEGTSPKGSPPPDAESRGLKITTVPLGAGRMEFTWPLSDHATATLTVTRALEPDDVETLTAYFEIAKRTLAKAAANRPAPGDGLEALKNEG
jgi:hypothetical protein